MNGKKSLLLALLALSTVGHAQTNFMLGIDNAGDKCKSGTFVNRKAVEALGVDFVIHHLSTPSESVAAEVKHVEKLAKDFEDANVKVIVNVECANTRQHITTKDGHEWVSQPGNLHIFKFPAEVLKALTKSSAVWGLQYDELEHMQITRGLSVTLEHPDDARAALAETTGMTFQEADAALYKGGKALVDECKANGSKYVLTEHVWPVLFHNFARAGFTPVYKQQKENWSNVWASCAVGACLQYNQELWSCIDFWNFNYFPGHSAQSFWGNLLFAYWVGADKAYAEAICADFYELLDGDYDKVRLMDRGEMLRRFKQEYLPKNARPYTFRDIQPEIAIIRFDDTEWGQGPDTYCGSYSGDGTSTTYYWKDYLFGAYDLNRTPETEEWMKAWNTITHGYVSQESLSWNSFNAYGNPPAGTTALTQVPYRCFAPCNFPVVFDDQVTKEHLQSVKLAFLCGVTISEKTLQDVTALVKKGMTVVTSKRYAPKEFADQYSVGTRRYRDGKGLWIITDDMASADVKNAVAPFLGKDNEITMRFKGNRKVTMRISSNGKEISNVEKNFK